MWFSGNEFSAHNPFLIVILIGAISSARLFQSSYLGVFLGLKKHFSMNVLTSLSVIMRWGLSTTLLLIIGDIIIFFISYLFSTLFFSVLMNIVSLKQFRDSKLKALPRLDYLIENKEYILGLSGHSILNITISQFDRLIVSIFFSTQIFSIYMFVSYLSFMIIRLANPIYQTFFPKFVDGFLKDKIKLSYHFSNALRLVIFFCTPLIVFGVFGFDFYLQFLNIEEGFEDLFIAIVVIKLIGYFLHSVSTLVQQLLLAMKNSITPFNINLRLLPFYCLALIIFAYFDKIYFLAGVFIVVAIIHMWMYALFFMKNHKYFNLVSKFRESIITLSITVIFAYATLSIILNLELSDISSILLYFFSTYSLLLVIRLKEIKRIFS